MNSEFKLQDCTLAERYGGISDLNIRYGDSGKTNANTRSSKIPESLESSKLDSTESGWDFREINDLAKVCRKRLFRPSLDMTRLGVNCYVGVLLMFIGYAGLPR